jgi:hypothetical protein
MITAKTDRNATLLKFVDKSFVDDARKLLAMVSEAICSDTIAGIALPGVPDRREVIYRFLDHLSPDGGEAITPCAFMWVPLTGLTTVGEFHASITYA